VLTLSLIENSASGIMRSSLSCSASFSPWASPASLASLTDSDQLKLAEAPLVPSDDGGNLYIRPTLIETSESFGIKEDAYAAEALMYIVTTKNLGKGLYPAAEGKGIRLDACKEYIRAWPGGTGSYKLGANYGQSGEGIWWFYDGY
jgi:branched-subunit amino acid aminotransferase/4-amino-4-deoxychorismate lyase